MRQSYDYNPYGWTPPVGTQRSGEFSHQAYARQAEDEERARLAEQEGIWVPKGSSTKEPIDITVSSNKQTREQALADPYSHLYKWENIPEGEAELVVEVGTAEGIPEGPQKPLGFPLRRRVLDQDAVNASGVNRSTHKPFDQFAAEQDLKTQSEMNVWKAKSDYNNARAQQSSQAKIDAERRQFKYNRLKDAMEAEIQTARNIDRPAIVARYNDEFDKLESELYGQPQQQPSSGNIGIGMQAQQNTAQQNLKRATPQQTPTPMYPPAQASELQVEVGAPKEGQLLGYADAPNGKKVEVFKMPDGRVGYYSEDGRFITGKI